MTLYWFQNHTTKGSIWHATTAEATEGGRVKIERMGYATRVTDVPPVNGPGGEPTIEEWRRVKAACGR